MIATSQFVFVHMHKTGGQTLNDVIARCMPDHKYIGYHYPCDRIPEEYTGLPLVGMVRNPWDWYVSWYAFNTRPSSDNPLFFILSDGGQADFKTTVTNLINLGSDVVTSRQYRQALIAVLPETLEGNTGVGLTKDCIRNFTDNATGYYSWLFKRMHGDVKGENIRIGRMENLQGDFLSIMESLSIQQLPAMQSEFDLKPRKNSSKHSHYSCYYDDELRELVARKEKVLVDAFSYRFESAPDDGETIALLNSQKYSAENTFKKLLGRESNFLLLKPDFDVSPLKHKLLQTPEETWRQSGRENRFEVHKQTQALLLIHDDDFRHTDPTYRPLYSQFEDELKPLIDTISDYYQHNGFVVRLLFAKLRAGGKIPAHFDGLYSLINCHRIHIPIITNDDNEFFVGGERKTLRAGEIWEINNATVHAVDNNSSEDRVHLILDWVPHSTVREQDNVQAAPTIEVTYSASKSAGIEKPVSRNSPCPCNSGKKYKHCHGALN